MWGRAREDWALQNWKGPEMIPFSAPIQKKGAVVGIEKDLVGQSKRREGIQLVY